MLLLADADSLFGQMHRGRPGNTGKHVLRGPVHKEGRGLLGRKSLERFLGVLVDVWFLRRGLCFLLAIPGGCPVVQNSTGRV